MAPDRNRNGFEGERVMATRGNARTDDRSNTKNAGSTKRESTPSMASNQQSRGASTPATSPSNATPRSDQQRELHTTREAGDTRQRQSTSRGELSRNDGFLTPFGALVSSSPFALMRQMMDDMDQLFDSWQQPRGQALQHSNQRGAQQGVSLRNLWTPQVEVFERGNNIVVRAELPGLSKDDVDVQVDDDALVIRGERHNDVEEEQEGYYRSERSYGSFYRAIPLPEGIDPNSCDATFKEGVLEVTLQKPVQQQSKAKKINVR
jgi:HSP20 family protein